MSGPLTHKELITFILWQCVEELKGMETMAMKQGTKLKNTFLNHIPVDFKITKTWKIWWLILHFCLCLKLKLYQYLQYEYSYKLQHTYIKLKLISFIKKITVIQWRHKNHESWMKSYHLTRLWSAEDHLIDVCLQKKKKKKTIWNIVTIYFVFKLLYKQNMKKEIIWLEVWNPRQTKLCCIVSSGNKLTGMTALTVSLVEKYFIQS